MSVEFSDAGRLLIENWGMVSEIHKEEERIAQQLSDFLAAFDLRLCQCAWWDDTWLFRSYQKAQAYLVNRDWIRDDEDVIWIGIQNFTSDALFGNQGSPSLYVWVNGSRPTLTTALRESLESLPGIIGDVATRGNTGYVATHAMRTCLPDELDRFEDIVGASMVQFFSCYGELASRFTAILNKFEAAAV